MAAKNTPKAIITLSTKTGDVAKAKIPGQCYLANDGRKSHLGAPKITAKDVRGTLLEEHELVKNGTFDAGTRFVAPTPAALAYYIGNVEQGMNVGDTMVAQEDASFELDLLAPNVRIIDPIAVGPRGGVRGDRSVETQKRVATPERVTQKRNSQQARAIRERNANLRRRGLPAMSQDETSSHLSYLGL